MNIKNIANEIISRLDQMSSVQLKAIKAIVDQFPVETAEETSQVKQPIKLGFKEMSNKQFTFKIDDINFFVPTQNAMKKSGLDISEFRLNENGLLLYSGRETSNYVDKIAKVYGIDADKIILPTKDQTEQIYNNPKYKNALLKAEIYWILFIIDKNDENRNVSLKEYWKNPDNYRFCGRGMGLGFWGVSDPVIDYDLSAVLLGLR